MHPTRIVCPRNVRVAVPRLINLLKFWRSITRDSLGNARVVNIFATRYACARRSLTAKRAKNTGFLHFLTQPVRILTIYRLEPSSGFSLPFLCISRRLDQNWGSLLQTLLFFALFDATRSLTIYRLQPSSGFSLPFLCISRRLDQNWGSLLQTLPHTHTITQIIVRCDTAMQ